jgi:mono/diheme cytochrome c family protein
VLTSGRRASAVVAAVIAVMALSWLNSGWLVSPWMAPAFATEEPVEAPSTEDGADSVLLAEGASVYTSVCQACHQADGVGVEGVFPPLRNNENVTDPAYVENVVRNGRSGELIANGVTYNGVMPGFALSDQEVEAVVAYVVAGFPELGGDDTAAAVAPGAGTAATELPGFSGTAAALAFVIAGIAIAAVVLPQVAARGDATAWSWPAAWMKSAAIVLFFAVATVYLPSQILASGPVSRASRTVQDLVGTGVWALMLGLGLYLLWRGKREQRL